MFSRNFFFYLFDSFCPTTVFRYISFFCFPESFFLQRCINSTCSKLESELAPNKMEEVLDLPIISNYPEIISSFHKMSFVFKIVSLKRLLQYLFIVVLSGPQTLKKKHFFDIFPGTRRCVRCLVIRVTRFETYGT